MEKSFYSTIAAVLTVVLVVATTGRVAVAQNDCVAKLVQCAEYLNSTTPAATCCNAIRDVVRTQLPCLCNLYNNPSLLGGINMTQALELPKRCNLSADTSTCKSAMSPVPSSIPPPAVPGNDGNAAGRISFMGMPALVLFSAMTLLY